MILDPQKYFTFEGDRDFLQIIQKIAAEAFGVPTSRKSLKGIYDHVVNVNILLVAFNSDTIMGFSSFKLFPNVKTIILHGMAIDPTFHGSGLAKQLIAPVLSDESFSYIACTTQSPIVYHIMRSIGLNTFPRIDDTTTPAEISSVEKVLISKKGYQFTPINYETLVLEKYYIRCLYPQIPESKDQALNGFFKRSLSIENGLSLNAFLIITQIR